MKELNEFYANKMINSFRSNELNMLLKILILVLLTKEFRTEKINSEFLNNYGEFFNYGDKNFASKASLENAILKSKVDVLGDIFKQNIDTLKSSGILDMIFLIDASSSVGENNFQSEIKFVKKLLSDVTVDYNHTRIAVVTFSSQTSIIKNVDEISTPQEVNNKCLLLNTELQQINYTGGGTYTLGAFQVAKEIFEKSRQETKKVLFLITDGFSNGGDPVPLANELKKQQVTIFTIGIRNGNYKELYELASSPGELYSYLLDSFQEFESLARKALHVDLKSGEYVPLGASHLCNHLCNGTNCCDSNALCTCGTSTGHYSCLCQPGYYGTGLANSCLPCPPKFYGDGPNSCLPCPDIHHISSPASTSVDNCQCEPGFRATKYNECEDVKCSKLTTPNHGYFVKRKQCGNVINTACGVRCKVGYSLSGSSIRLCQTNGTWSGSPPSCQVKTCAKLLAPSFGTILCSHADLGITYNKSEDLPVDTICSFKCDEGKILIGSTQRTCLPLAQWDGLKTTCKPVKCSKLSQIAYGKIEPKSCLVGKQAYGKRCNYTCFDGFKIKGPEFKTCVGKHGSWNNKFNQTTCNDVTAPNLICPRDIQSKALKRKHYGAVSWTQPNVTDNSGLNVSVWFKPTIKNITTNFRFKIGKTVVTYFAQDAFQNKINCSFTVDIEDDEAPVVENCITPLIFLSTNLSGANISWDEPDIFDNSQKVTIKKSHEFGFFEVGTINVTYTATDPSNNTNRCVLNITVQPAHCEPLSDPVFGQSQCSSQDSGLQCIITCEEGYAVPLSTTNEIFDVDTNSTRFLCENSDPIWYSQEDSTFPDCSVTEIPNEILQTGVIAAQTELDLCNDSTKLNDLENNIRNDLDQNLKNICADGIVCNFNATAVCEIDSKSDSEEKTNKIKRDVSDKAHNFTIKNSKRKKRINVKFRMRAKHANKGNRTHFHRFKNLDRELQNMQFLKGNNVTTAYFTKMDGVKAVCPLGFVAKHLKCVQCPKGTFHNVTRNTCQSCPLGQFNDKTAQTNCTSCPQNFSTKRFHCKSSQDCQAHCPPGTHARKRRIKRSKHHPNSTEHVSLMPNCRPCPIGYYQSIHGQVSCFSCPNNYTTSERGSTSISDCTPTIQQMCKNSTTCNNGQCIVDSDFYYTCNCRNNFIGSNCEIKINICNSNPCLNEGLCTPSNGDYLCRCKENYSGKNCEVFEEKCRLNCENNGTCLHTDADEYVCLCPRGFGGELCERRLLHCRENICENNGKCVEDFDGFHCVCKGGYIGKRCNILPCDYQPCFENSVCTNIISENISRDSFICSCLEGYTGSSCQEKINYCKNQTCLNGGTCISNENSYTCKCLNIYYGNNCEEKWNSDYILHFPKATTSDFIKLNGFKENLSEVSACLWMQTLDNFNYGTLLSYATTQSDNTFTVTDYTGLVLYVNGQYVVTDLLLNDGFWHFLCITWQSLNGTYNIYLDGKKVYNGESLANDTVIKGNGNMVIGQEQDILGGQFSQSESFLGKMAYIDVWSRVLTEQDILLYMNSCNDNIFGDIYAWPTIKNFINGQVQVQNSTFCRACKNPEPLQHGMINVVDNVAYYNCTIGFDINEVKFTSGRKCTKASKWEGMYDPYCKKKYCGYPGYVTNGHILGRKYFYQDKIIIKCKEGYILVGNSTRICMETGAWSSSPPICLGVQCKAFPKPSNAQFEIISDDNFPDEAFDIGTQIEITCVNDTKVAGQNVLTCQENGNWDFAPPECELILSTSPITTLQPKIQCKLFPKPTNAQFINRQRNYIEGAMIDVGTPIEISCQNGSKLIGERVLTCQDNGNWNFQLPGCEPIESPTAPRKNAIACSLDNVPKPPANGYILPDSLDAVGNGSSDRVQYKCRVGYKLEGDNLSICIIDGYWTEPKVFCNPVPCKSPTGTSGKNMKIKHVELNNPSYHFGNMIVFECDKGYTMFGNNVVRCLANGRWSRLQGRCSKISCYKPDVLDEIEIVGRSYLYDDEVVIICPSGRYKLKCGSDGKWLGNKGIDC